MRTTAWASSYLVIAAVTAAIGTTTPAIAAKDGPAFGAPGAQSSWSPGDKSFLGTARSSQGRVWFTGYRGILSEIAFGNVTQRQFNDMGFIISGKDKNGATYIDREKDDADFVINRPNIASLRWIVTTTPKDADHGWKITKEILVDPTSNALVMNVTMSAGSWTDLRNTRVFLFTNPSISNSGGGTNQTDGNDDCKILQFTGEPEVLAAKENSFTAFEAANPDQRAPATSAVAISNDRGWEYGLQKKNNILMPYQHTACTFLGPGDGFADILVDGDLDTLPAEAVNGNVLQFGQVRTSDLAGVAQTSFRLAVGFASGSDMKNAATVARTAVAKTFSTLRSNYDSGWSIYLNNQANALGTADAQVNLAIMSIKASEDKQYPGAIVAGLGIPWGDAHGDWVDGVVGGRTYGGYMLMWPRDMVQKGFGLLAAGDEATALAILKFLFNNMMQETNANPKNCSDGEWCEGLRMVGRFPQNSWLPAPGQTKVREYWSGTQQDEIALPIVLAQMLYDTGSPAIQTEVKALWPKINLAAQYLVDSTDANPTTVLDEAPYTHQERWEEVGGLSPSSLAAQIAGLVAAAEIGQQSGASDTQLKVFRRKADLWRNHAALWMMTSSSPYTQAGKPGVNGTHYLRINSDPGPNPNSGATQDFKNGLGPIDERAIVDAGFLDFVRLGVVNPVDWTIRESIPEVDHVLRQDFDGVPAFFRYNGDAYGNTNAGKAPGDGDTGRGRLWPIFTAERGLYEIALAASKGAAMAGDVGKPHRGLLETIGDKAFGTGFVPEQVWANTVQSTHPGFSLNNVSWQTTTPPGYAALDPTTSSNPLNWAMGALLQLSRSIADNGISTPSSVCSRYACKADMSAVTFTIDVEPKTVEPEMIYLTGTRTNGNGVGKALLGDWAAPTGVPMKTTDGTTWSATVSLPKGSSWEFKFVRTTWQKPQDDAFPQFAYEPGANRTINVGMAATQSWSAPFPITSWGAYQSLN